MSENLEGKVNELKERFGTFTWWIDNNHSVEVETPPELWKGVSDLLETSTKQARLEGFNKLKSELVLAECQLPNEGKYSNVSMKKSCEIDKKLDSKKEAEKIKIGGDYVKIGPDSIPSKPSSKGDVEKGLKEVSKSDVFTSPKETERFYHIEPKILEALKSSLEEGRI